MAQENRGDVDEPEQIYIGKLLNFGSLLFKSILT